MSEYSEGVPLASGQGTVKTLEDFGKTPEGHAKRWKAEIDTSKRGRKDWARKAEKVLRRYRDERDTVDQQDRKFNVLWSNIQVMKPAIYAKPPKPEVSRKFDMTAPAARVAATIMERNLEYFVCEHSLFDQVLNACVLDRLLPGQGTAWVRYSANLPPPPHKDDPNATPGEYAEHEKTETPQEESGEHANAGLTDDTYIAPTEEKVCYDYVHWKDFLTSSARTWEEVTWVARRVYLTQSAGVARFGDEFKKVPLNYKEKDTQDKTMGTNREFGPGPGVLQKAAVWEIWDKESKKVFWLCEDYPRILDERKDLLELVGFFPCPKPLLATTTTDSIIPIPDYVLYQDQAMELDSITNRISMLTQALKVIGVYDKTQDAVQRILTEGVDNVMIPVDNWAMFAERGGLKGVIDFFPVDLVSKVLTQLIQDRNVVKQDIYEITGIADIVRGASVASETATAQSLKAKFAGIRINDSQKDVARFAADLLNMSAEVMTNFFQPETLVINADMADQANPDFVHLPAAIQLIKDKALIKHRITVSVDAITEADAEEEQEARIGFLTALGQFMQQGAAAVEAHPELATMMGHITLWGVRGFKVGRDLEGVIEQGLKTIAEAPPPEKKPDPAQQKAEAEMAQMQEEFKLHQQESQAKLAQQQQEGQQKLQQMQQEGAQKLQQMQQEFELKMTQMQQEFQLKMGIAKQEGELKQATAAQEMEIKGAEHAQAAQQASETHAMTLEQQEEAAEAAAENKPAEKED